MVRKIISYATGLALVLAIVSNAIKASGALASAGQDTTVGLISAVCLAIAVELMLLVSSYQWAQAKEMESAKGQRVGQWVPAAATVAMATGAWYLNALYYSQLGHDLVSYVVLGVFGPAIAVLNGLVAGRQETLEGVARSGQAEQVYNVEMRRLGVEQSRQERLQALHERRAAEASVAAPARELVRLPATLDKSAILDAIERQLAGNPATSHRQLAAMLPVSRTTVGNYVRELQGSGRLSDNGRGE